MDILPRLVIFFFDVIDECMVGEGSSKPLRVYLNGLGVVCDGLVIFFLTISSIKLFRSFDFIILSLVLFSKGRSHT